MFQGCARLAILLVPDGSLSFKQTLVFVEGLTGEGFVKLFCLLAYKRDESLDH